MKQCSFFVFKSEGRQMENERILLYEFAVTHIQKQLILFMFSRNTHYIKTGT